MAHLFRPHRSSLMSTRDDLPPYVARLIAAGFTFEELRTLASDLMFAAMAVDETGESIRFPTSASIEWTAEKRAAWLEAVREAKRSP